MDALKSYSGEESASEEENSPNSPREEDDQPEEDSVPVASSPKAVTTDQKEREQTNSPPARPLKEEGERGGESIKTGQVHRKRKSRSRSRGRSPEHESPSSHRRSHDHHHYRQQYKGRDYRRRRSRSRSRSPAGQRRGSYHKRRSRSRSRSPTHRRSRRSRSPDYHHRRRRSSSGDKRGSRKRRSKSPSERGRRTERKGDSSTQSGGGDKGKTDGDLAASQDTKPTGFSAPPTAPPPSQPQQLQEKNGTLVAAPSAVAGAAVGEATAPAMVTAGQGLPTPPTTVPQSAAASTVGLLPHPDNANFTPEQRLELAMAVSKAKDLAKGPQLPGFMNPTAMNPVKFQQIKEKRKLLWSGKKAQKQSRNQWESVSFGTDNKETAKFRRLMGISDTACTSSGNKDVQEEHSKRLSVLEHQYESSRFQTHVARGIGLGYGSEALTTELPSQKDTGDKLDEKL